MQIALIQKFLSYDYIYENNFRVVSARENIFTTKKRIMVYLFSPSDYPIFSCNFSHIMTASNLTSNRNASSSIMPSNYASFIAKMFECHSQTIHPYNPTSWTKHMQERPSTSKVEN